MIFAKYLREGEPNTFGKVNLFVQIPSGRLNLFVQISCREQSVKFGANREEILSEIWAKLTMQLSSACVSPSTQEHGESRVVERHPRCIQKRWAASAGVAESVARAK